MVRGVIEKHVAPLCLSSLHPSRLRTKTVRYHLNVCGQASVTAAVLLTIEEVCFGLGVRETNGTVFSFSITVRWEGGRDDGGSGTMKCLEGKADVTISCT